MSLEGYQIVRQWVETLYGSTDEALRQQANAFLTNFHTNEQAWETALSLLNEPNETFQYYGIQVLQAKLKHHWGSLGEAKRAEARHTIMNLVLEMHRRSTASFRSVQVKACITWVWTILHSIAEDKYKTWLDDMVRVVDSPAMARMVLDTLGLFPEEYLTIVLTFEHQQIVKKDLLKNSVAVAKLCMDSIQSENATVALECMASWTLLGLELTAPIAVILSNLAMSSTPVFVAAISVLQEAAYRDTVVISDPAVDGNLIPLLKTVQRRYEDGIGQGDWNMCHAVCTLATTLAQCKLIVQQGTIELFKAVLGLVCVCTQHPDKEISRLTFEGWYTLERNREGMERSALLREAQAAVLPQLLEHAMYETDFTTWADRDEDEKQEFNEVRDECADTLLSILATTEPNDFFALLQPRLAGATSWQHLEVVLFALKSVIDGLDLDEGETNFVIFDTMFQNLSSLKSHPILIKTTLNFISEMAAWLRSRTQYLTVSIQYLLQALEDKSTRSVSARAFRDLCIMLDSSLLPHLPSILSYCTVPRLMEMDQESAVVLMEAATSVIAKLPQQDSYNTFKSITAPLIQGLDSCCTAMAGSDHAAAGEAMAAATKCIKLAGCMVSYIDMSMGMGSPETFDGSIPPLLSAWPFLAKAVDSACSSQITGEWRTGVLEAVCKLLTDSFRSPRTRLNDLTPVFYTVSEAAARWYTTCDSVAPLQFISAAFTLHSSNMAQDLDNSSRAMSTLISILTERSFALLQADLEERTDIIQAFFKFLSEVCKTPQYIGIVVSHGSVAMIVQLAIASLSIRERQAATATLSFLIALCKKDTGRALMESVMTSDQAPILVDRLLSAIAGNALSAVIPTYAAFMFELVKHYSAPMQSLLMGHASQHTPWLSELLTDTDRELVMKLFFSMPDAQRRFISMIKDLHMVCIGTMHSDTLVAYTM